MNTMPTDYVTKKDLDRTLDRILKQIFDYINVVNEGMAERIEKRFDQKLLETKISLKEEITGVRKDLQNYQENNSRMLQELKDMNKSLLGMLNYHENRISIVEKKSHTPQADML